MSDESGSEHPKDADEVEEPSSDGGDAPSEPADDDPEREIEADAESPEREPEPEHEPEPVGAVSEADEGDGAEPSDPTPIFVDHELEPSEISIDGIPIRRIARTFREEGAVHAGAELTSSVFGSFREVALPLGTLVVLITILITFRQILLPFILACALVYLMEPIIRLMTRRPGRPRGLPRWVAVLLVYLSFIAVISTSVVVVVPTFVAEIVRFAEEVPKLVQEFRTERLPGLNENLQDFLRNYLPVQEPTAQDDTGEHLVVAQTAVLSARKVGAARAAAFANAQETVRFAASSEVEWQTEPFPEGGLGGSYILVAPTRGPPEFDLDDSLASGGWVFGNARSGVLVQPLDDGTLRLDLNEVAVEVEAVTETSWVIRQKDVEAVPLKQTSAPVDIDQMFDLEERLDDLIQNLVSTSNERLAEVIEFAQKLVVGVVGTFVGVLLTLMVAGFIAIDLPRVMAFLRSLVPRRMRSGYDVLLEQLDTGLAGVVRGQLLICVVNGVLTYIGLVLIGVKFQVLLAVIAGILSLIPVFGTVLSTIPIVLIGLTDSFSAGVLALAWILGIHALEANLLNPKIIGSSAHIHPVIVIFALLAGESAYGLVGALLAVPTASILLTLFNFVRTKAWTQAEGLEPSS